MIWLKMSNLSLRSAACFSSAAFRLRSASVSTFRFRISLIDMVRFLGCGWLRLVAIVDSVVSNDGPLPVRISIFPIAAKLADKFEFRRSQMRLVDSDYGREKVRGPLQFSRPDIPNPAFAARHLTQTDNELQPVQQGFVFVFSCRCHVRFLSRLVGFVNC